MARGVALTTVAFVVVVAFGIRVDLARVGGGGGGAGVVAAVFVALAGVRLVIRSETTTGVGADDFFPTITTGDMIFSDTMGGTPRPVPTPWTGVSDCPSNLSASAEW